MSKRFMCSAPIYDGLTDSSIELDIAKCDVRAVELSSVQVVCLPSILRFTPLSVPHTS